MSQQESMCPAVPNELDYCFHSLSFALPEGRSHLTKPVELEVHASLKESSRKREVRIGGVAHDHAVEIESFGSDCVKYRKLFIPTSSRMK